VENGGPDGRREDEVFRFDHGLQRHPKKQTLGPSACSDLAGCNQLQSMDDSLLGLHSCRALSPKPRGKIARAVGRKELVFGLSNRLPERLNVKPEDQQMQLQVKTVLNAIQHFPGFVFQDIIASTGQPVGGQGKTR
jgi:hypothetical protein